MISKAALFSLALLPSPAFAMTGAELMASKEPYNLGYVYGVVEMRVIVQHSDDPAQARIRDCLNRSKVNVRTIYDLTIEYMKRNPSSVTDNAVGPIINTLAEMCP